MWFLQNVLKSLSWKADKSESLRHTDQSTSYSLGQKEQIIQSNCEYLDNNNVTLNKKNPKWLKKIMLY